MSSVASPCIKLCRLHPRTGLCEGCLRSGAEIAAWPHLSDTARQALLIELHQRGWHPHEASRA